MHKPRETLYVFVFLVLVLLVWGIVIALPQPVQVRLPDTDGFSDFSDCDFSDTVFLHHNYWENYPEKLYTPEDFASGVPKEPVRLYDDDYTRLQYATHKMQIKLIPDRIYGLSMKTSDYSMRIFINDVEFDSVGIPGETAEATVPRVGERTYFFQPETEVTTIIVQAANFVHGKNGAFPPDFTIGYYNNIVRHNNVNLAISFAIIGCLLTAFLYHLGLYCLNRRRKMALYFSIACLLLALMNKDFLLMLFPNYNWYVAIRVEYIVHFLTFATLTRFLDILFPKLLHKFVSRFYYIFSGLYIMTTFIPDTRIFTGILVYFEIVSVGIIGYIFVRMAMSLKGGSLGNYISFIGVLVLGLLGANDILYYRGIELISPIAGQFFMTPIGMVFFVFCNALVISIEYAETEHAMIEAQAKEHVLAADNAALDRLNRMKGDLIATVSHETKTPLAVLSGYAELIAMELRRKGVDAQTAADLDQIADETQRIAKIMAETQNLSRTKDSTAHKSLIKIDDIIQQTAKLYTPILARKKTTLILNVPDNIPCVYANTDEITQVLFNLLQNSRNHIENGNITISASSDSSMVIVKVMDTGNGIPPELLPFVFQKYRHGTPEGTGLGLPICKEIVEGHGGEILIESELDKGTVVTFTLPLTEIEE